MAENLLFENYEDRDHSGGLLSRFFRNYLLQIFKPDEKRYKKSSVN